MIENQGANFKLFGISISTTIVCLHVVAFLLWPGSAYSQVEEAGEASVESVPGDNEERSSWGFGLVGGLKYIYINYEYEHNTHPDDGFLDDADVDGSAGTTEIDKGTTWGYLGLRAQKEIKRKDRNNWSFNADIGFVFGGHTGENDYEDFKQNDNDPRSEDEGSNIYSRILGSDLEDVGLIFGVGGMYHLHDPDPYGVRIGGDLQVAAIRIENGWNRFNADEVEDEEFTYVVSAGPKVSRVFVRDALGSPFEIGAEASAHLGVNINDGKFQDGIGFNGSLNLFLLF